MMSEPKDASMRPQTEQELMDALRPFAEAARAHGVRKASKDDLWVSLGVASSAWAKAAALLPSALEGSE